MPKVARAAALLLYVLAPAGIHPQALRSRVTLTFALTPEQRSDLDRLLDAQHNPDSPDFHRWLTPEQFAQRFGATAEQFDEAAAWLRSEGLTVEEMPRSRRWIVATGSADRAARRVPSHLAGLIGSFRSSGDLRWTSRPRYTTADGTRALAPADLAAIYGAAGDGEGQTIAIAGVSNFLPSDIQEFRSRFGLPERTPRVIVVGEDPGYDSFGGMIEAVVDLQWAGAMAPKADLVYIYSRDIIDAVRAAVDRNLAPVLNFSFGICEANLTPAEIDSFQAIVQQANAQGMTFVAGSGDNGPAACNFNGNVATLGYDVMFPASLPEATAVGGTQLNEGSSNYWSNGTATSYIPEIAWNDTVRHPTFAASGGGASRLFAKPRWQAGPGVPLQNARYVPDVAFSASSHHNPYVAIVGSSAILLGGTSVSAPVFAGLIAVLNQRVGRVGNINPMLYGAHDEGSSNPWFHDIVEGDNIVQCFPGTRDCVDGSLGYRAGPGFDQVTGLGSINVPAFVDGIAGKLGKLHRRRSSVR